MLLPHLAGKEGVALRHVATNRSLSALDAKRRFGFAEASTDAEAVLSDESLDAVFVVTRHHSHADLTCRALRAGKAVFVEKPLALSQEQLAQVMDTVNETGNDRLMVGFNRRFAPDARRHEGSRFAARSPGSVARYSVNAGQLGSKAGTETRSSKGSRFAGEGGHFIDTLAWWFDAVPTEVYSMASKDPHDIQVNLRFSDGSVAVISYVTNGNPRYPKEILDVAVAGRTARLDNFRRSTVWSGRRKKVARVFGAVDKGQAAQLETFLGSVRSGAPHAHIPRFPSSNHKSDARRRNEPGERQAGARLNRQRIEWYWRRLRRMSAGEMAWRGRDAAWQSMWARRQIRPGEAVLRPGPRLGPPIASLLPDGTGKLIPDLAKQALTNEAESILKGHLTLLGVERSDLSDPDWFFDPVTERRAPKDEYAFKIEHRSESVTGNVKADMGAVPAAAPDPLVSGLVRHRRRRLCADGRPPAEVVVAGEPFLSGVNWTSGIEVGIRLISFVWIRRLLDGMARSSRLSSRTTSSRSHRSRGTRNTCRNSTAGDRRRTIT